MQPESMQRKKEKFYQDVENFNIFFINKMWQAAAAAAAAEAPAWVKSHLQEDGLSSPQVAAVQRCGSFFFC